eukprot:TRINITY_DN5406_c0_g1_i1.p1 TRINITY_DN5406_c0_g1~~TRINITY_DN5406_c0_g1_i1.p1  ORF type:complete len:179 (+),score=34.49 TRINITY_DN5406_c0_g1_i1:37-573(+)
MGLMFVADDETANLANSVLRDEEGMEIIMGKIEAIQLNEELSHRVLLWPGNVLGEIISPLDRSIEGLIGCVPPSPDGEYPSNFATWFEPENPFPFNFVVYSALFPCQTDSASLSFAASLSQLLQLPNFPDTREKVLQQVVIATTGFGTFRGSSHKAESLNQMRLEWKKFISGFSEKEK